MRENKLSTTATSKTIDKAAIQAAAEKARMSVAEFVEWGMHAVIGTFSDHEHSPGDLKDYLPKLRSLRGGVAPGVIRQSPIESFIEAEGISAEEFAEAAILSAIALVEDSVYPNKKPVDFLKDAREERRLLLPEIGNESDAFTLREQKVHPFMHRLFSGDLKAVHGPTFGDLASDHVGAEHHLLHDSLERIFEKSGVDFESTMADLQCLESVIRHCPALQNEAAAIRAMVDAEQILIKFNNAVAAA